MRPSAQCFEAKSRRAHATVRPVTRGTVQRTVATITNGPRWRPPDQLPALSRVRMWKYQRPSASAGLVAEVVVSSASLTASGNVAGARSQRYEKPSTPLPASVAADHRTSTVRSRDATPGWWLVLSITGSTGGVVSGGGGAEQAAGGGASSAFATFSLPPVIVRSASDGRWSTLPRSSSLSSHTDLVGLCASRSAAAPATWGVAIEVPLSTA